MYQSGGRSNHRVTVALSLSQGSNQTQEKSEAGGVHVLHRDGERGIPGGLGMPLQDAWASVCCSDIPQQRGNQKCKPPTVLGVRTSFVTAGDGEGCTLSYAAYVEALANCVASTLLDCNGVELLTLAHGPSGSGKTTQLFGSSLSSRPNVSTSAVGLFPLVLQQLFAVPHDPAEYHSPVAAVSVVEWRLVAPTSGTATAVPLGRPNHGNMKRGPVPNSTGCCGSSRGDDVLPQSEAVDLLARAPDASSPTRCFMEDYADIPAARYVLCSSVHEVQVTLHEAFSSSLAWRPVDRSPEQPSERTLRSQGCVIGDFDLGSPDAVLSPVVGSNSHLLVTLLIRSRGASGCDAVSIWRLWDLCGPPPFSYDRNSSHFCLARSVHMSLLRTAQLMIWSGGLHTGLMSIIAESMADEAETVRTLPRHISDVVPLTSTAQQSLFQCRGQNNQNLLFSGLDSVSAMIEACVQHSCSSVLWMAALRRGTSFDVINKEVLRAAAAVSECGDSENADLVEELRRQRRQENLRAAERVINIFAVPFKQRGVLQFSVVRGLSNYNVDCCSPKVTTPNDISRCGDPASSRLRSRLISPVLASEAPAGSSCADRIATAPRQHLPSLPRANCGAFLQANVVDVQSTPNSRLQRPQGQAEDLAHPVGSPHGLKGHSPVTVSHPDAVCAPTPSSKGTEHPNPMLVSSTYVTDCPDISRVPVSGDPSFVSQHELEGVAHVLQRLLEHPLAQLQEVSQHYREQLRQQRRAISNLSALFHSGGLMLSEVRQHEHQQEKLLAAAERNSFLEQRLQRLERENNELRTQLNLLRGQNDTTATLPAGSAPASGGALAGTPRHIVRASGTNADPVVATRSVEKQSVGVQTLEHRGEITLSDLAAETKEPQHRAAGRGDRTAGSLLAGTCTSAGDTVTVNPKCYNEIITTNGAGMVRWASQEGHSTAASDDSSASAHLLDVLARATKVAPSSADVVREKKVTPTQLRESCASSKWPEGVNIGTRTHLCRWGELSITSNESGDICADLRAFREAVTAARDGALRALYVAKEAVRDSCVQSLSSCAVSVCNGDTCQSVNRDSEILRNSSIEGRALRNVWEELGQQETKVSKALDALQREALALEQNTLGALSREKQLLSRAIFAE
ncbi:hypothetical protein, conserved [Trypanosoma brucei gambiense DAL972]|uniref:Kinesin n=1 Tax=Trypanosoma brucei gambiense (strain MHOM/CI/86/DAL972) TaxID=679716 RepID=C9ZU30_TRYB9|nr:hypothetical protein, conserved [Trypanosoma brucei gambiense DAL972]CBH12916.1 hypothetical protein, conserved [Trypanosoma brucei gambiense DAL972]|eukprot:XP_011775195.1 hypothetical protein, conserved [Trypanosoma brucei gambiense DAL972]